MNFKGILHFLFIIILSVAMGLAIQSVVKWAWPGLFKETTDVQTMSQSAQSFVASLQEERQRPPQTTIAFVPKNPEEISAPSVTTEVKTQYGALYFSTRGGALSRFDYQHSGKQAGDIITPLNSSDKTQEYSFWVALTEQTPDTYTLVEKKEIKNTTSLVYRADGPTASITKEFIVDHEVPRINLKLTIDPHNPEKPVRGRLFLPAPFIPQADQDQQVMGLVYEQQKIKTLKINDQLANQFWLSSTLPIGAEDRYFLNALINDTDGFTRRAFLREKRMNRCTPSLKDPKLKKKRHGICLFIADRKTIRCS